MNSEPRIEKFARWGALTAWFFSLGGGLYLSNWLMPSWSGAIMFGGIVFFLSLIVFLVVRWRILEELRTRRARRGACLHCGYSREGIDVAAHCPECGRTP